MPRAQTSGAAKIVGFFRTAPMEVAVMVMDLCREAIKERKDKSDVIRAAQAKAKNKKAKPAPAAASPKAVPTAKVAKPRKRKRNRAATPASEALPPQDEAGEPNDAGGDASLLNEL